MSEDRLGGKERRKQVRALLHEGRRAIAQGLPNPVSQTVLVGAGLVMRGKLAGKADAAGASAAAEIAARFAGRAIDRLTARGQVACRRGCAYCCQFAVFASPPEIFWLARSLRDGERHASLRLTEAILARSEATRGLALDELTKRCLPCVLLAEGECAAYVARPITCRQFLSFSAEACERNLKGEPVAIPVLKGAINAGVLCRNLLLAAGRSAGLPDICYELSSALAVALSTPMAERRWLGGENVFAGALATKRPQATQDMIDQYAGLISAWA